MSDAPDDIGADIMRAMQGDTPPEPVETEILPPNTQGDDTAPPEIEGAAETRPRDEHGRFAKSAETVQDAPQAQQQEPAKPTILPPKTFTPQEKAAFLSSPPEIQQAILRREKEIEAGFNQQQSKAEQYNKLDAAIAPVRDRIALSGLTPDTYIRALVQADEMLRGPQKAQALQLLAQQYGIDLGQMIGGPAAQQPNPQQAYQAPLQQPQFDPEQFTAQVVAKVRAEAAQEATLRQIEEFSSDPAHIYFHNVEAEMTALLQSGAAKDLKQAYTMACNARDDIRQLMAAGAASKAQPAQTRPAGPQVTGAQRNVAPKANGALSNSSYEDDVRAAYEEAMGKV